MPEKKGERDGTLKGSTQGTEEYTPIGRVSCYISVNETREEGSKV